MKHPTIGIGAKVLFQSYRNPNKQSALDAAGIIENIDVNGRVTLKHFLRTEDYHLLKTVSRGEGEWVYKTPALKRNRKTKQRKG